MLMTLVRGACRGFGKPRAVAAGVLRRRGEASPMTSRGSVDARAGRLGSTNCDAVMFSEVSGTAR